MIWPPKLIGACFVRQRPSSRRPEPDGAICSAQDGKTSGRTRLDLSSGRIKRLCMEFCMFMRGNSETHWCWKTWVDKSANVCVHSLGRKEGKSFKYSDNFAFSLSCLKFFSKLGDVCEKHKRKQIITHTHLDRQAMFPALLLILFLLQS